MISRDDFIPRYIDNLEKLLWDEIPEGEYTLQELVDMANEIISGKLREV